MRRVPILIGAVFLLLGVGGVVVFVARRPLAGVRRQALVSVQTLTNKLGITKPNPSFQATAEEKNTSDTRRLVKGTVLSYDDNTKTLTVRPLAYDDQIIAVIDPTLPLTCWPRYMDDGKGGEIDVATSWFDWNGSSLIHLDGETTTTDRKKQIQPNVPIMILGREPSDQRIPMVYQLIIFGCRK